MKAYWYLSLLCIILISYYFLYKRAYIEGIGNSINVATWPYHSGPNYYPLIKGSQHLPPNTIHAKLKGSKEEKCKTIRDTYRIETGVTWGTAPKNVQLQFLKLGCEDKRKIAYNPKTPYPSYGTPEFVNLSERAKKIESDPSLTLGG